MDIFPIKGAIQHYAWGGKKFIPKLLGEINEKNEPFAELWMGTHDRGTSIIEGKEKTLSIYIKDRPKATLGKEVAEKFDDHLPFLFKILDVKKMLSIQTHPTKKQAEIGFKNENETGVPLDAKNRNFKDDNHKPEIMVALTDFWLLHGFLSESTIADRLEKVSELSSLQEQFKNQSIYQLYKYIMELPQHEVDKMLTPLEERLSTTLDIGKSNPDYWAKLAFRDYTGNGHFDRGIFSIYLFNLVNLKPGEAIFQDAGIPHAYLEGVNVELMANSDNVFRGGLTPKHIDVPELLRHLNTEAVTPNVLRGKQISEHEKVYTTPAPDFEVSQIHLQNSQSYHRKADAPDIVIVLEGAINVTSQNNLFQRKKGEIFFAGFGMSYEIVATKEAVLYRATVP